jgi:SpoVK/Ycf46/Vps4 family AAA+-type ATPase
VSRINVLVAATSIDTKAATIAERVSARADMNLVGKGVIGVDDVDLVLDADPSLAQVAIVLLGRPEQTRELAERWIAKRRGLVVMLADLVDDIIRIEGVTLRDPRLDALLTALRQLVEQVGQEASERVVPVNEGTPPSEPDADGGGAPPSSDETVPAHSSSTQSTSDLLSSALKWLDAVLKRYLDSLPKGDPGLARTTDSVDTAPAATVIVGTPESGIAQDDVERAERELRIALDAAPDDDRLAALSRRLDLTFLEFRAVLLCLAPELDVKYQSVFGVLNGDFTRRAATLGPICAVLEERATAGRSTAHDSLVRHELAESAALTRWALTDHGSSFNYADQLIRLDAPLAAWLLATDNALLEDRRLAALTITRPWPGAAWVADALGADLVSSLVRGLEAPSEQRWIALENGDLDTSRAAVEAAAVELCRPLIRVSLQRSARSDDADIREIAVRAARAVQLADAVLAIDAAVDAGQADAATAIAPWIDAFAITRSAGIVITPDIQPFVSALGDERVRVLRREPPDTDATAAMLSAASASAGLRISNEDAARLGMSFPLSLGGIDSAVNLAVLEGATERGEEQQAAALASALRRVASPDLPRFAHAVDPTFDLDDVVLPEDRIRQLREIVAHVRYAYHVLQTWGFRAQLPYGRGVAALFSGPSGTGKTMAAQAIAHELGTRAYLVDLSRVVSKYIGDTEKFLDAVFNDAERAGAVLLFDEADALFGKRSEIKDSHDRYANIEVAYLLHRMEAFSGLAILTTNLRRNIDDAFLRRLRFVVPFPKPDARAREAIWRFCLPDEAPLAGDVNLRLLARRLELTGGSIRQITIRAAFAAAADASPVIAMRHLIAAARAELMKLGMTSSERELTELEAAGPRASSLVA